MTRDDFQAFCRYVQSRNDLGLCARESCLAAPTETVPICFRVNLGGQFVLKSGMCRIHAHHWAAYSEEQNLGLPEGFEGASSA